MPVQFINMYKTKFYYEEKIIELGGKIHGVTSYTKNPIKYIFELRKIIIENNYEVVHCNMNSAVYLYPLIAAKLAGVKTIIAHSHNNSNDKGFLKSIVHNVNKYAIPLYANKFYACSIDAGKYFFSKKIVTGSKFMVIYNGINTESFAPNTESMEKKKIELGIDSNAFVVGHVGRFTPQKNHEYLINVFKHIVDRDENARLILIGKGQLEEKVLSQIKEKGLEKNVLMLGNRNDVEELMQVFDVFVLPSLYEGLGIVLIEAQSAGVPCVTTDEIPEEAELNKTFKRISLKEKQLLWAEEILGFKNITKIVDKNIEKYDINKCAQVLEEQYLRK